MFVAAFLLALLEVAHRVHQLVEVLDAADVLGCVVTHENTLDAGTLDCFPGHCQGVTAALIQFYQTVDQSGEALQFGQGASVDVQLILLWVGHHLPHAHPILGGAVVDLAHSRVADAAGRVVDDTPDSLVVIGIDNEPEIADGVFHLLALVERQAAIDAVGNRVAHITVLIAASTVAQGLLEDTGLSIGAVEHGIVLVAVALARLEGSNLVGNDIGLLIVAEAPDDRDFLAHLVLAEQMFGNLTLVFLDEAVGGIGDGLGGTVIALELEGLDIGIEALQSQDVVDVGAAEAIDALGIIAHDTQPVVTFTQLMHNQVLREVCVLILVHKDITEKLLVPFQNVLVITQQNVGVKQQIIKVHCSGNAAAVPVCAIDGHRLRALGIAVGIDEPLVAGIVVGRDQGILGIADLVLNRGGLIYLVIKTHILDNELDE